MKGTPLLRLGIILALLAAAAWPACRLTRRPDPGTCAAAPPTGEARQDLAAAPLRATLLIHAAPAPLRCSVSQNGRVLLSEKNLSGPGEYRAETEIAPGMDLIIGSEWSNGDPHAIRAEVLISGSRTPLEKTYWATSSLEDSFPLPESFQP